MATMVMQNSYIYSPSYDSPQLRSKLMNGGYSKSPDRLMEGKSYNTDNKPKNAQSQAYTTKQQGSEQLKEAQMTDVSRNELQALLKANKAEVDAVASAMKTEMANFRTSYTESFKDIAISLNNISAKSDATEKRLTQAQWIISLVISVCAIMLSIVIFFSNKTASKPAPSQQPSVVVNTMTPSNNQPTIAPEKNK